MVRLYVTHCPAWAPERRTILEQNLKSRGFKDVVWVTSYPASHPFVRWIRERLGKHFCTGRMSGFVKHMEAMEMFVNDPSSEDGAIFCDDDCLFIKDWESALKQIPPGYPFVNLSVGVNWHILPDGKPRDLGGNNGGCEAIWKSKQFCKLLLDNTDARSGLDHVYGAMIKYIGYPLVCIPIAQQTSLLCENKFEIIKDEIEPIQDWQEYLRNFKPTGLKWQDLKNESGLAREDI